MFGDEEEGHIGSGAAFMMIAVALLIDGIQFLLTLIYFIGLIINPFISICATMIFGIWLSHLGVSMMAPKRVGRFLGTIVGETVLGSIPIWTFSIVLTVIESRVKEVVKPPTRPRGGGWRL